MENNRGVSTSILITMVIILALTIGIIWFNLRWRSLYSTSSIYFWAPHLMYMVVILVYLPTRVILYTLYKPYKDRGYRPMVSVVIPAFNEERFIQKSIRAVLRNNYPKDKLEIIVVNDGSRDRTKERIEEMVSRFPGRIKSIHFPKNRGKREAMAEGVRKAIGEIIVFIDSDTRINRDAITYLVAPFEDERVGGTTGKIKVHNYRTNFLTRMLGVRYVMSFDFYRATASVFGGITCLSGVMSAYRRSIIMDAMPEWLTQRFMGRRATFGDDRSLTNHTLKRGYRTVYSRGAVAHTLAPENLFKLFKMLVRWNKSFIRESIILYKYLLHLNVIKRRKMLFYDSTLTVLMPIFMMFIIITIYFRIATDPKQLMTVLGSISTMAMVYMLFYIRSERSWQFVYGIVYAFFFMTVLIWLLPYSLVTVNRNHWGTR